MADEHRSDDGLRVASRSEQEQQPMWVAERDRTNAVSHEAASGRQPTPVPGSPLADRDPGPTTSQLREQIQSGATGDKVAYPDPAAAPLGTDAEAGGHRPTTAEIETALRDEQRPAATRAGPAETASERRRAEGFAIWFGLVSAIIVVAAAAAIFLDG